MLNGRLISVRLNDYLERIGLAGSPDGSIETLQRLHVAHRETFLFENVSIQAGGAISLAIGDIERKFLDERRGGYCFEQNTLFAAMLRDCGFECTTLLGRVRRGPPETWARTHMVLRIQTGSEGSKTKLWLADVGFGAIGLIEPIPLRDGAVSHQRGLTYFLRREPHVWVLSMRDSTNQLMDLYEFSEEPQTEMDVVVANHYTSTHPDSIFRRSLTVQGLRGNDRIILRSHVLTQYRNGVLQERPVDALELRPLARELFSVELGDQPLVCEAAEITYPSIGRR